MHTSLAASLLALTLVGCGYNLTWDLDMPFAPLAVDSAELPQATAQLAFKSAIEQLGGNVSTGGRQQVRIVYDASCSCQTCTNITIAHTERFSQDTIRVCPRWKQAPFDTINDIIFHELGHVLSQWDHLPCENAMMSPRYDCRADHGSYNAQLDIPWICAGSVGGVRGGRCR